MEDWWLPASLLLVTVLVSFLVYWFVIRKPSAPSSSCTVGADCSSNVSTKDPQWLSYMWDSSCNCNLVSCQSGYDVSGGKCVATPTPSPGPGKCDPGKVCTPTTKVDNGNMYLCNANSDCILGTCNPPYLAHNGVCVLPPPTPPPPPPPPEVVINGIVNGEKENYAKGGVNLQQCQDLCHKDLNCKVYDYDENAQRCAYYNDYRSVRGYGGVPPGGLGPGNHTINRVQTDGKKTTYVRPFASNDPEMGSGKMAYIAQAKIVNNTPYGKCSVYSGAPNVDYPRCANQCNADPNCQAVSCDANGKCSFFSSGVNYVNDLSPDNDSWSFLKLKSAL